jgi:radical SAM family uncharacterized protein/radical SAM-linked protein
VQKNLSKTLSDELLGSVEKASRYLGTELNAVHKDKATVDVRLALIFPDLYDLGLGNLGIHILYAALNELDWCWAERAYAPAKDMEALLREQGLPLFANESRDALSELDGLGFTLQSELTYTNILNIIDLSGIPLRTKDRRPHDPLTFAGGPAVFNPEPIAPFMDFFVIGDGEDAIMELALLLREMKDNTREEKLERIAQLKGFYVPALYPMDVMPDGRVLPPVDAPKIQKRITADLDGAKFPVDYIVPFTQQVHDRISLEVLRGCTQGCRFCQAGMTTRPVRERSLKNLKTLMEKTLEKTGYEEVSLVSLSTCDYSRVQQLVDQTAEVARANKVSISLPSLRLDSFSVGLADQVTDIRRTGLTFAPEAASPRLRAVINKWIPDEDLITMATQAYSRGWKHVKLYFMIGLPTERDDDVMAIGDLTLKTLRAGREINDRARVHIGVSTFVPKPFTPFQWAEQIDVEETWRRQNMLSDKFAKSNGVKFGRHNAKETFLEGLVSRTDRRTADLIEAAFRLGARFDAWSEHMDFRAWQIAIEETNFDVKDALRARDLDERLPWDHIDVMIPKTWFQEDWRRAEALEHAPDCRHSQCHRCGVIDVERDLCAHMLRNAIDGAKDEGHWTPKSKKKAIDPLSSAATTAPLGMRMTSKPLKERVPDPEPIQRLRFRISRIGDVRYLSHLELAAAWIRALRRANAPLAYSQGFHQHPKVTFSTASPVGEESTGDFMDVVLSQTVDPEALFDKLISALPDGLGSLSVTEVPLRSPSLMSLVEGFTYTLTSKHANSEEVRSRIAAILSSEEVIVERKKPRKGRRPPRSRHINIRPMIAQLALREGREVEVDFTTCRNDDRLAKWREVAELIGMDPLKVRVLKHSTTLAAVVPAVVPAVIAKGSEHV